MPPEQNVPAYHIPTPPAPPVKKGKYALLITLVIILVLLALAAAAYFFTPLGKELQAWLMPGSLPQELRGAAFLSDVDTRNTTVYRFPASGKTSENAEGSLVAAAANSSGSARIIRGPDGTFRVYMESILILQDQTPRIDVDIAPDGRALAFAVASDTLAYASPAATPLLPIDRTRWNSVLYLPASHKTLMIGPGVSPFFIDKTHVAWLAPAGLSVINLITGASMVLVPDLTGRVPLVPMVSPDHSTVAWYAENLKTLQTYKVTGTTLQALAKTTLPDGIRSVTLGNDGFYEVKTVGTITDILKQPFGGADTVAGRLPASLKISRMLFGS